MVAYNFPLDIKVYINGIDITYYIFGSDTFTPTPVNYIFRDIDLSSFISTDGVHELRITSGDGDGRVDARVEIK